MTELIMFFMVLILLSTLDIRAMKKANLMKEIIPYLVLTLMAGVVGFLFLVDPHGESVASRLLNLLHLEG